MAFLYLLVVLSWLLILTIYLYQYVRCWDNKADIFLSFLVAVALLPQVLGVLSLVSFLILPNPGIAHYIFSLVLAVPALRIVSRKISHNFFKYSLADVNWLAWLVPMIAAILVIPVLLEILYINYSVPLWCHDSLIYANEGRVLVEGGSLKDIPWFGMKFNETVTVNHAHGPLFTAWLAQALLSGDSVLRLVFQGSVVSLLSGVAALGRATGICWAGTVAVVGFLTVPAVGYLSYISSRDGFRIAPLLVLVVMIIDQSRKFSRTRSVDAFNLALATCMAGLAHAFNLIFLPIIGVVGLLAGLAKGRSWRSLSQWLWLPALILILLSLPYLSNLYRYDHPLGLGVYYPIYKGTAMWDGFIAAGNWGKSLSIWEVLNKIQTDYGAIQTWGLLVGLWVCMILGWKTSRSGSLFWIGCVAILIAFGPALLTVNAEGANLSGAFSTNLRYPMSGYAFLGLAIYLPLVQILKLTKHYRSQCVIMSLGLAFLIVGSAYLAKKQVEAWPKGNVIASAFLEEGEWRLIKMARQMARIDGTWYTDNYSPAYYATGMAQPEFLFTRENRPLLTDQSVPKIINEIVDRNIGMVTLSKTYLSDGWSRTPLYRVLSHCDDVEYLDLLRWEVFSVQPTFSVESCQDILSSSVQE